MRTVEQGRGQMQRTGCGKKRYEPREVKLRGMRKAQKSQCLFEAISYLTLASLTLLTCWGWRAFFPYRKRFGKDNVILSDIRKPPAHVFHSGKI